MKLEPLWPPCIGTVQLIKTSIGLPVADVSLAAYISSIQTNPFGGRFITRAGSKIVITSHSMLDDLIRQIMKNVDEYLELCPLLRAFDRSFRLTELHENKPCSPSCPFGDLTLYQPEDPK